MLYINGKWKSSNNNKSITVYNPATLEKFGTVAYGGKEEAEEAIQAASAAFQDWKKTSAVEKSQYLRKIADCLRDREEDLAVTITKEMGKPLKESLGEVKLAISYMDWYAEEAKRIYGETIPASSRDKRILVLQEPVGVTGAITPWNFPAAMVTRKIAPALAAGCPVILKPASATPLTAAKIFEAIHQAGLPKGVANLIIGPSNEIAQTLLDSKQVRKLTFTGSTAVGKKLMRDASNTVKKVSMELGGHAPFIVFEDADLEKAAEAAVASKFRNAGQTCVCTNRIYVQKEVAEEFTRLFAEKVNRLQIGNGMDDDTDIGPLINEESLDKVVEHVEDAKEKGGVVICGGSLADMNAKGVFYQPTVIQQANESMKIAREETFGPVVPIFTFETEEEAIERANHPEYGLASYCFTSDLNRAFRVMESLEYGIIGINDAMPTTAQAPFGGMKESGVGREGGKYGLMEYLEEKFVSLNIG
ncbi:NAD-dependent succinate-semialdehyde dehydrogenase [Cytobacillus oceanisediminis]|uniref:NAD-dependent succinate-semialdehyde dehydrogenase n=1 Tax=Cytobacillus oceanisediminis TaxID=665099 RepID=UPI001C20FAB3|nr:NAD-dependent succinate-semialdehyde dehydrogenase [Cytobacillus oceanisediminis]MBU8769553.1 NAD-dependent succinate-semialdehyde dehydrogenase [Cytobacillus oceanisediminis]